MSLLLSVLAGYALALFCWTIVEEVLFRLNNRRFPHVPGANYTQIFRKSYKVTP